MKLKDLKKIIAEEIQNISTEQISEGPCGFHCYWNGVLCCSTACEPGNCLACCMDNVIGGGHPGSRLPVQGAGSTSKGPKGEFEFVKGPTKGM